MADSSYGGPVLLDNSAWARVGLGRLEGETRDRWEEAVLADELVVSPPFALEAMYSARSGRDFLALAADLSGFRHVPADERTWQRAADAQAALAADTSVSHRVKPLDLLIAAVADQHGFGVLHFDHDYETIRDHTPLAFRSVWIAPRGSLA